MKKKPIYKHVWFWLAVVAVGVIIAFALPNSPSYADVPMKQSQVDEISTLTDTESMIAQDVKNGDKTEFNRDATKLSKTYKKLTGNDFTRGTVLVAVANQQYNKGSASVKDALGRGVFVWVHADVARKVTGKSSGTDYKKVLDQLYKDYNN